MVVAANLLCYIVFVSCDCNHMIISVSKLRLGFKTSNLVIFMMVMLKNLEHRGID